MTGKLDEQARDQVKLNVHVGRMTDDRAQLESFTTTQGQDGKKETSAVIRMNNNRGRAYEQSDSNVETGQSDVVGCQSAAFEVNLAEVQIIDPQSL